MHNTSLVKLKDFVAGYLAKLQSTSLDILDIGAQSVDGHATYRPLFTSPRWRYQGLDVTVGNNVDIVVDSPYDWSVVSDASVDVVVSGQALEHIELPWLTMQEIYRVLKPGGVACLVVPSAGPEHRYPTDCWRMYPDGLSALGRSAGFTVVEVFTDWGLLPWQDTFGVFQKPHSSEDQSSPLPVFENKGVAFAVYRQALAKRPRSPLYYSTLSDLLEKKGEQHEALRTLRIGLELFPAVHDLRQMLVAVLVAAGQYAAAAEHVLVLMAARPISPANVKAIGTVFNTLSYDQRQMLSGLLPPDNHALGRMAQLAGNAGCHDFAVACWSALIDTDAANISHRLGLAGALLGAGERAAARDLYHQNCRQQIEHGVVNRTTVLQRIIDAIRGEIYLEIGVETGDNFFQIAAPAKFAVDPQFKIPGGPLDMDGESFFAQPSDAFFLNPPELLQERGIDVALVDGLHTWDQALRDIEHCLRYLKPGGVIVVHDCLPATAAEAAPTHAQAKAMPEFSGNWTGDVYRAIIALRMRYPDLDVAVLNTDHGVGLIRRRQPETLLELPDDQLMRIDFDQLDAARERLLNLKSPNWFNVWLKDLAC
jgi:SAM-dependent methyltransferase